MTREAILGVALRAVQANGSAGLTLREVARELGVSLPTLQRHFATKDDLWRACVDTAFEHVGNDLAAGPPGPATLSGARAGNPSAPPVANNPSAPPVAGNLSAPPVVGNPSGPGAAAPVLTWHLRQQIERAARVPRLTAAMSNDFEAGADQRLDYLVQRAQPLLDRARALVGSAIAAGAARPVDVEVFLALVSLGLGSLASSQEGLSRLFGIDLSDQEQRQRYVDALADLLLYGLVPRAEAGPA